jgi:predicted DNA-binding transcriptional regulator AlpA
MSENQMLEKPYLNEKEVSAITGRAISTLRNERFLRRGLPYLKIGGRSIRYRSQDVIAYMESRLIIFDEATSNE